MHSASSNPNDLPLDVALAIEENSARSVAPSKSEEPDAADSLVQRLLLIRERLFWLQAVWANTLSPDIAREADRYREVFRELSEECRKKDADAVDRLIAGHEALLLSDLSSPKPTVPIEAQQFVELKAEVRHRRSEPPKPTRPDSYVADGLQNFV